VSSDLTERDCCTFIGDGVFERITTDIFAYVLCIQQAPHDGLSGLSRVAVATDRL